MSCWQRRWFQSLPERMGGCHCLWPAVLVGPAHGLGGTSTGASIPVHALIVSLSTMSWCAGAAVAGNVCYKETQ